MLDRSDARQSYRRSVHQGLSAPGEFVLFAEMARSEDDVLSRMISNNRTWAAKIQQDNPGFFERLAKQQTTRVLWIGCSDSRVPDNEFDT
jgi:hypothetical protein